MMGMKISYLQSAELEGSQKIKVKKEGNIDPNIESLHIDSQRCPASQVSMQARQWY